MLLAEVLVHSNFGLSPISAVLLHESVCLWVHIPSHTIDLIGL